MAKNDKKWGLVGLEGAILMGVYFLYRRIGYEKTGKDGEESGKRGVVLGEEMNQK